MSSRDYSLEAGWSEPTSVKLGNSPSAYNFRFASNANDKIMAVWVNADTELTTSIWASGF
jgi:hypothetical protein